MTNPDWAKVEQWATVDIDPNAACILELRARVEALEANSKPTPNLSQIRSLLLDRVHSCIVGEPEVGRMQARAVIREVAAWLREHVHCEAADELEAAT